MEEKQVQRLVGSIIVIVIAIVILFILFSRGGEIDAMLIAPKQIPEPHSQSSININKIKLAHQETEQQLQRAIQNRSSSEQTMLAEVKKSNQAPTPVTQPTQAKVAAQSQNKVTKPQNFNLYKIQLASFAHQQNAKALKHKLQNQDYPVFIETTTVNHKLIYKVFIGPFTDYKKAQILQKNIATADHLNGIIRSYQTTNLAINK